MMLVGIGALLVIVGVVVTAISTLRRGRLSEPRAIVPDSPRDTLEPSGRGRRLSVRSDLPGLALMGLGAVLLLVAAAT
jgi:hypothetical protein